MALCYKFYRNSFIKVAILSVGCVFIFVDYLRGNANKDTEPRALILLAVIMVVGNVWLFTAMRRAKHREQLESLQTTISDEKRDA